MGIWNVPFGLLLCIRRGKSSRVPKYANFVLSLYTFLKSSNTSRQINAYKKVGVLYVNVIVPSIAIIICLSLPHLLVCGLPVSQVELTVFNYVENPKLFRLAAAQKSIDNLHDPRNKPPRGIAFENAGKMFFISKAA
jgi:hypothetical protein